MIRSLMLSDPSRGLSYQVKPAAGIAFQGLSVDGAPRTVTEVVDGADGVRDFSRYRDAAAVTLKLTLTHPGTRAALDALALYCDLRRRPLLTVDDDEWASPRYLILRWASNENPIETGRGLSRIVQYAWTAPEGAWRDTTTLISRIAAVVSDTGGMTMTDAGMVMTDAGIVMTGSSATTGSLITVAGTGVPRWQAKLYGPVTGPALTCDSTGESVAFTDALVIPSGDYVEISSYGRSALYLSNPDASRLALLDYAETSWFDLEPGTTAEIRYHASAAGAGAIAEVSYQPMWLP